MANYFNYFTEIEDRYLRRRGGGLLLSTLDWALIETWKDAGIPIEAALRGIDRAFDHYDQRPSKTRKINSLAYCSQEVLAAAEDMKEAAVGSSKAQPELPSSSRQGFDVGSIVTFLRRNTDLLESSELPRGAVAARAVRADAVKTLRLLADEIEKTKPQTVRFVNLEALATGPHKAYLYPICGCLAALIENLKAKGVQVTGTIENPMLLPWHLVAKLDANFKGLPAPGQTEPP